MFSYSKFYHSNSKFDRKYKEPISKDYRVFVNGEEIPVYTCRISKMPFNRAWPGYQRPINQTELASFVNIVSDEAVNIEVIINGEYEKVILKPYSKQISYADDNGKVSFTLNQEGQFVLSTDDLHNLLYIFNSKPITCENPESVTHYFGPGVYMPGKIVLHDNESVYIDKDALVFGCIYADNAKNVKIFGNGLLDDSNEERFDIACYQDFANGNMKFYDCENLSIKGVLMRNSAVWCVNIFHCFDVDIDNVKVFGQWRYNTDGVDIVNSQRIILRNSFIHSFDDTVTIKGIDRYITTDNTDILTENCVLMCDWGKCCEIGLETACREYKNIVFRDCDVIKACHTALDIQNGDCAEVHDVLYENIRVELDAFSQFPIGQDSEEQEYDMSQIGYVPEVIAIRNTRFRGDYYCNSEWGIPKEMAPLDLTGVEFATAHDITFKDIKVYYDERIPKVNGKFNAPIFLESCLEGVEHYNIKISNMTVNGEVMNENNAQLKTCRVKDLKFENDEYAQLKKNTVDARNQLKESSCIRFSGLGKGGMRVMFVGNSITLHSPAPQIGWNGDYGMAASSIENDYVHILMNEVTKLDANAEFCICQVARWESEYKNGNEYLNTYCEARNFGADIIVGRLVENVPIKEFEGETFYNAYKSLLSYLDSNDNAKFVLTDSFWKHPGDTQIEQLANDNGYVFVKIGDLGELDEMKAIGLFEHGGVAIHPGDKGMKAIAERIWDKLSSLIK